MCVDRRYILKKTKPKEDHRSPEQLSNMKLLKIIVKLTKIVLHLSACLFRHASTDQSYHQCIKNNKIGKLITIKYKRMMK